MSHPALPKAIEAARRADATRDPSALRLWEDVARLDPSHIVAWSKIGILQSQAGNFEKAVAAFETAVRAGPFHAALHFNLARAYFSANKPQHAANAYQAAAQLKPDYAEAYLGWVEALGPAAPALEILSICEAACACGLTNPLLEGERGRQLIRLRRSEEAVVVLRTAVALDPEKAALRALLSAALLDSGQPQEALAAAEDALLRDPDSKDGHLGRAAALLALDRVDDVLSEMPDLVGRYPNDAPTLRVFGIALAKAHRFNDAVQPLTESANLDGRHVDVWEALGTALGALHQPISAAECFQRSDNLLAEVKAGEEARLRVLNQRINFLSEGMLFEESIACCDEVSSLTDKRSFVVGRRTYALAMLASWTRLPESRAELADVARLGRGDCSPFSLFAFFDDPELHRDYSASHTQIGWGAIAAQRPSARAPCLNRPLRIGYLSADFREHPVGRLVAPLFENHDPEIVEVVALSTWLTAKDMTEPALTKRIRAASREFIELGEMKDEEAAQRIREAGLDVVIDLCGHTLGSRPGIFARGCAPLQLQYLGFPGTTGATFFDAIIADSHVIPSGCEQFYSERVIRLQRSYLPPGDRPTVEREADRSTQGLPKDAVVLGAFHSTYKISPEIFSCWMQILSKCPKAVLWLNIHDAPARSAISAEALSAGISSERVLFAERESEIGRHLVRMTHIDLMLDTYPYGSHSAALDALWSGVPILACEGRSFASRVCAGLLRELGLHALITSSLEAYTERAIELVTNQSALGELRNSLTAQRDNPIFDPRAQAQDFEHALLQFVREFETRRTASDA